MSILIAFCIFFVSVLVHESGHFLTGRLFNYAIEEFSIGMGPKLLQKSNGEVKYTIRLLPLGGYVKFSDECQNIQNKRKLSEPSYSKFLVLIMGVIFNIFFAMLCFFIVGLLMGGSLLKSLYLGIYLIRYLFIQIADSLYLMTDINNYSSIVALPNITNEYVSMANNNKEIVINILVITAAINFSIAIMNLLPLPILDGGQFVINIIEVVLKKKIPEKIRVIMNVICWGLLMGFSLFLIIRDIISL